MTLNPLNSYWADASHFTLKLELYQAKRAGVLKYPVGEIIIPLAAMPSGVDKKKWVGKASFISLILINRQYKGQTESERRETKNSIVAGSTIFGPQSKLFTFFLS